jgi:hypothetical protein
MKFCKFVELCSSSLEPQIRNYTFEQLMEDCCRFWDLFPPDVKLVNQHGGKWALDSLVEQEWIRSKGDGFIVRIVYIPDEEGSFSFFSLLYLT